MELLSKLALGTAAGGATLYGLHRLGLYLERVGLIYYRTAPGGSSGGGLLLAAQEFVQPNTRHVVEAQDSTNAHWDEREKVRTPGQKSGRNSHGPPSSARDQFGPFGSWYQPHGNSSRRATFLVKSTDSHHWRARAPPRRRC